MRSQIILFSELRKELQFADTETKSTFNKVVTHYFNKFTDKLKAYSNDQLAVFIESILFLSDPNDMDEVKSRLQSVGKSAKLSNSEIDQLIDLYVEES